MLFGCCFRCCVVIHLLSSLFLDVDTFPFISFHPSVAPSYIGKLHGQLNTVD